MADRVKEILDEWRSKHHVEWTGSGYAPVYDKNNEELAKAICQLNPDKAIVAE